MVSLCNTVWTFWSFPRFNCSSNQISLSQILKTLDFPESSWSKSEENSTYFLFARGCNLNQNQKACSCNTKLATCPVPFPYFFLPTSVMSVRRPKPAQHWHFPVIPCWLLGIQKEHPELWIKCQAVAPQWKRINIWWCMAGSRASWPEQHPQTWHTESGLHLVTSRGKASG